MMSFAVKMSFTALVAALVVSQVDCPTCPTIPVVQDPNEPDNMIQMQYYPIFHDGVEFTVFGYIKPGSRLITWQPGDPFNKQSLAKAKADVIAKAKNMKTQDEYKKDHRLRNQAQIDDRSSDGVSAKTIRITRPEKDEAPDDSKPKRPKGIDTEKPKSPNWDMSNGVEPNLSSKVKAKNENEPDKKEEPNKKEGIDLTSDVPAKLTKDTDFQNFGLEPSKMFEGEKFYASSKTADKFVENIRELTDNQTRMHLTIIGSDDQRARVLADLESHPALAPYKGTIMIQGYRPGEWEIDQSLGFTPGDPSIMIEGGKSPSDPKGGKVLWRSTTYDVGPEGLAEALRKARLDYHPNKDTTPDSRPRLPLSFSSSDWPTYIGIALVILILFRLPRKA